MPGHPTTSADGRAVFHESVRVEEEEARGRRGFRETCGKDEEDLAEVVGCPGMAAGKVDGNFPCDYAGGCCFKCGSWSAGSNADELEVVGESEYVGCAGREYEVEGQCWVGLCEGCGEECEV